MWLLMTATKPIPTSEKAQAKFWARVEKTDGCWNWTGAKVKHYGVMRFEGKIHYVHRVSAAIHGVDCDGLEIDAKCYISSAHIVLDGRCTFR